MKKTAIFLPILMLFTILACTQEKVEERAQWRGAMRDGIYHETELLDTWPEDGPELLWVFEGLGLGYAAPAVTSDGLYINHLRL